MSSESVCQVAHSWVDVGSLHTRLVVRFNIFAVSVRNILDTPSYWSSDSIVIVVTGVHVGLSRVRFMAACVELC
jgi:hypothetical protein